MAEESRKYLKSKRQLEDSYRWLAKVCRTLPNKSQAQEIVKQLNTHLAGFLEQTWPAEVNAGLAQVYGDLAEVIKNALESKEHDEEERHFHIDSLLVCTHPTDKLGLGKLTADLDNGRYCSLSLHSS